MSAYGLWAAAASLLLALLTCLVVRAWDRSVAREIAHERQVQAELQAVREAEEAARRAAEAQRIVLLHEVNHRARNALTVAQSLVRLTHGGDPARASEVTARIAALAGAHDLLAESEWTGADLPAIVRRALAPFEGTSLTMAGPQLPVLAAGVQPLSMMLHELATNAVKYGALSRDGRIRLEWRRSGTELVLTWSETGGPPITAAPTRQGVGTRVIEAVVAKQLGGRITREWREAGLVVEIAIPESRLVLTGDQARAPRAADGAEGAALPRPGLPSAGFAARPPQFRTDTPR